MNNMNNNNNMNNMNNNNNNNQFGGNQQNNNNMNNQMNQNQFNNNNMQFNQNNNNNMNNNPGNDIEILKNNLSSINANSVIQICKSVLESNQIPNKSDGIVQQLNQQSGNEWFAFVTEKQRDNYDFRFSNNNEMLVFNILQYQVYVCPLL